MNARKRKPVLPHLSRLSNIFWGQGHEQVNESTIDCRSLNPSNLRSYVLVRLNSCTPVAVLDEFQNRITFLLFSYIHPIPFISFVRRPS